MRERRKTSSDGTSRELEDEEPAPRRSKSLSFRPLAVEGDGAAHPASNTTCMQLEDDPDALEEEPPFESVGITTSGLCFRTGGRVPICMGLQDREVKVCLLNLVNTAARVLHCNQS